MGKPRNTITTGLLDATFRSQMVPRREQPPTSSSRRHPDRCARSWFTALRVLLRQVTNAGII